ncbi:hypothetical protein PROFUN_05406 [Planoprotostelium fungivorum]|uniref:Uncharacterized protein n=1 Tax=Planoprotostelium fungivorum TaxID=1890364 RepID=A0A2P6NQN5_9EUKA|nr:hypothetical protein PROFUN_05406 [Planoprotostelium fungivorum]
MADKVPTQIDILLEKLAYIAKGSAIIIVGLTAAGFAAKLMGYHYSNAPEPQGRQGGGGVTDEELQIVGMKIQEISTALSTLKAKFSRAQRDDENMLRAEVAAVKREIASFVHGLSKANIAFDPEQQQQLNQLINSMLMQVNEFEALVGARPEMPPPAPVDYVRPIPEDIQCFQVSKREVKGFLDLEAADRGPWALHGVLTVTEIIRKTNTYETNTHTTNMISRFARFILVLCFLLALTRAQETTTIEETTSDGQNPGTTASSGLTYPPVHTSCGGTCKQNATCCGTDSHCAGSAVQPRCCPNTSGFCGCLSNRGFCSGSVYGGNYGSEYDTFGACYNAQLATCTYEPTPNLWVVCPLNYEPCKSSSSFSCCAPDTFCVTSTFNSSTPRCEPRNGNASSNGATASTPGDSNGTGSSSNGSNSPGADTQSTSTGGSGSTQGTGQSSDASIATISAMIFASVGLLLVVNAV